jgi:hypothetical protein
MAIFVFGFEYCIKTARSCSMCSAKKESVQNSIVNVTSMGNDDFFGVLINRRLSQVTDASVVNDVMSALQVEQRCHPFPPAQPPSVPSFSQILSSSFSNL